MKKKPLLPKMCIKAVFKEEKVEDNELTSPAPVFASCVRDGVISAAFGNPFKPVFESVVRQYTICLYFSFDIMVVFFFI